MYGFRLKRDAEWETCAPVTDTSWELIAEPVMKLYTETTDGSTIEDKETALVWCYEDADPDFGSCQAKELLNHLESVLTNEPVTVKSGLNNVEVKPQVRIPFVELVVMTRDKFFVYWILVYLNNLVNLESLRKS
jgi:trehalose 6-phosphate synthase/phosphatase